MMNVVALIPAYNPPRTFPELVRQLLNCGFTGIVVVDDGSSKTHRSLFAEIEERLPAVVLRHAVNLGKGAALKTGLNYSYCHFPDAVGVITIDADGQHLPEDTVKIARKLLEHPSSLVLGVREFSMNAIPWRSRFGNSITKTLFRLLTGTPLQDTQTGLRGIPLNMVPALLRLTSNGYEFEIDMLLITHHERQFVQEPITTVYLEENRSSHFNPIFDSMKIYFVLFRFTLTSFITALIDYSIFFSAIASGASLVASQSLARLAAMVFNYFAVRHVVFISKEQHLKTFPKYLTLVFISGLLSYQMITLLERMPPFNVLTAKIASELLIFLANFAIQRVFIFQSKAKPEQTDWTRYYQKPFRASGITRRLTAAKLHSLIRHHQPPQPFSVVELGGANSCFLDAIMAHFAPSAYHVVDNCSEGLAKLRDRVGNDSRVIIHDQDIFTLQSGRQVDLAFSVGLIEHFDPQGTSKAIRAHFELLKPGGIAIFFFPTPTLLYRGVRRVAEVFGLWIFHDERPLKCEEVLPIISEYGTLLENRLHASAILTQRVVVARKFRSVPPPKRISLPQSILHFSTTQFKDESGPD